MPSRPLPGRWIDLPPSEHLALHPTRPWLAQVTADALDRCDLLTGERTRLSDTAWPAIEALAWAGQHLALVSKAPTPRLVVLHGDGLGPLLDRALSPAHESFTLEPNLASLDLWMSGPSAPWEAIAIVSRTDEVELVGPWSINAPSRPSLHPDLTGYAVGEHRVDKSNVVHVDLSAPPTKQTLPALVGHRVWRVDWTGPRTLVLRVTPNGSTMPFHCELGRADLDAHDPTVLPILPGNWLFAREPMLSPDRARLVVRRRNITDRAYKLLVVDLTADEPEGRPLKDTDPSWSSEHAWLDATTLGVMEHPIGELAQERFTVIDTTTLEATVYTFAGASAEGYVRLVGASAGRAVFHELMPHPRVFVSDRLVTDGDAR